MNDNILEISNLSKSFGATQALDNVSLEVARGSITGILGPNGAGKTTLLRIINSILAKDAGEVKINGEDVSLDTVRKIGYMPEERGLYDKMTLEDQIIYFGELKGGKRKRLREVMKEYLELFNLSGSERRKVKELSKGNQQKVQIIATIVHEPDLVILDEPFSGFDPINGALLQQLIERLHEKETTIMLSSHNMPAIEEMCSDIAIIDHGHLLVKDRISDIKEANKTSDLIFTTASPLSLSLLESSGLISGAVSEDPINWRKGYAYRVTKNAGVLNSAVINEIALQSEILQFEEALPTLNDIFIKYTTARENLAQNNNNCNNSIEK